MIKDEAAEDGTIVVQMDFAENHTSLISKDMLQAHWAKKQATLFTIHLKDAKDVHHRMSGIGDDLAHEVELVHVDQGIISEYVQSAYRAVKCLDDVSAMALISTSQKTRKHPESD